MHKRECMRECGKSFVYRGTQTLHRTSPPNHAVFLAIIPQKNPLVPFKKTL